MRVLVIEDDDDVAAYLGKALREVGGVVDRAADGKEGLLLAATEPYDVLVVDRMLPGLDGLSVCRELRPRFNGPIVMLTALDSDMNQILGLELGANDYILKTTPPAVLLARLRVQLRASRPQETPATPAPNLRSRALQFGALRIDPESRDVRLQDERIVLSTADFDLLWELATHAGQVLNREQLFRALRGIDYDGLDRSIDVAISRLRRKLHDDTENPQRIKTVRQRGYLLAPNAWQ